jgi:FtsH-binding integral membrane protein
MYRATALPKTYDNAVDLCIDFYLDIINLFLDLLEIF